MTASDFAELITAPFGLSLPFEEFVREWEDIFWLNEPVSLLIASLKSRGYTLILGSNTNQMHADYFRRRFAATLELFDALVLSYEVGCLKPDSRFYEACARAAGVPAGSCVFIDDMAENVDGARKAGLQALQYVETATLIAADYANSASRSPLSSADCAASTRQIQEARADHRRWQRGPAACPRGVLQTMNPSPGSK